MLWALSLLTSPPQARTINLFRGAAIVTPRYWDVEDTYLDAVEADKSFGGSYTLIGGKGKTILIRFGDLNRLVGPNKHITKATLFLTPGAGAGTPVLRSAGKLLQSWGEGKRTVLSQLYQLPPKPGATPTKVIPPQWEANYKQRKASIASWQSPGAGGANDQSPIATAHAEPGDKEISITGLEGAVQDMIDHPERNFGFALNFDNDSEFSSSKANTGRPRLEIETADAPVTPGPDLSVISISSEPATPRPGQDVTYTATIKNVGTAASQGFTGNWLVKEKTTTSFDKKDALAPGATTTVTIQKKFDSSPTDHRLDPIEIRIEPTGPDACSTNNALTIQEDAIPVVVAAPASGFDSLNYQGSQAWQDWAQAQVKLWNDTVAAQSFFSFAPEGALERIRINGFAVAGDAATPLTAAIPADASPTSASVTFLKSLGLAAGLIDGSVLQIPASKVQISGSSTRSNVDLNPGIMGYGDTRFEGSIPGVIPLAFQPIYDPKLSGSPLEPTDLLAGNDVAALNAHLTGRPSKPSDNFLPIPKAIIVRALDYQGTELPNTDLLFFQASGGSFAGVNPVFATKTNGRGVAVLNTRGAAGPFGDLTPNGDNSVFLIQAKHNGVLETAWMSAWQLAEEAARKTFTVNLYLNLPGAPLDKSTDQALDRIVTDSAQDLPAKLAPLIDDDESTATDLPDTPGSWVEIDLGRDRTIGEVDLVSNGKPFWQQFDIVPYGTGQHVSEGLLHARELNWAWSSFVRRDASKAPGAFSVAYRGFPQRVRYIRIINKSGGAGSLNEIRIFAANLTE